LKNITKQDLIQEASKSSGHAQTETRVVAEQFMKVISEMLYDDQVIEIRGFGTFYTKERKPRPARNPRTGEICPLGRRQVALFRFSPDVRCHINDMPELREAASKTPALEESDSLRFQTSN